MALIIYYDSYQENKFIRRVKEILSMKNKILLISISTFFSSNAFCQQLKSFSGNFQGGQATYTYSENSNQERIYQGEFKFKRNLSYGHYQNILITGKFNNNLKDGNWRFTGNDDDANPTVDQITIEGKYLNGKKIGKWVAIQRAQTYSKKVISQELTANFKNDTICGVYKYTSQNGTYSVLGQFDNNGNYDGDWIIKNVAENSDGLEDKRKYIKGFLISRFLKNSSTGEIYFKNNFSELLPLLKFNSDSSILTLDYDFANRAEFIKLDNSINGSNEFLSLPTGYLYDLGEKSLALLGGDDGFQDLDFVFKDSRIFGRTFYGVSSIDNAGWEHHSNTLISDEGYVQLMTKLNSDNQVVTKSLELCENYIKSKNWDSAIETLNNAFSTTKSNIIKRKINEVLVLKNKNNYDKYLTEGNNLFNSKEYNLALKSYKSALEFNSTEELRNKTEACYKLIEEEKTEKIKQAKAQKKYNYNYFLFTSDSLVKTGALEKATEQLFKAQECSDAYLSYQDPNIVNRKDIFTNLSEKSFIFKLNHENIFSSELHNENSVVYNSYIDIVNNLKSQNDIFIYYKDLLKLIRIQDKILIDISKSSKKKIRKLSENLEGKNLDSQKEYFLSFPWDIDGKPY